MEQSFIKEQVDDYQIELAEMFINDVEKIKLGFISDNCDTIIFSMLIHCLENIDIFNDNQIANITHYINTISYGN